MKIAFKMDYRYFKGTISLVFTYEDNTSDDFEIFNLDIKAGGLIYT